MLSALLLTTLRPGELHAEEAPAFDLPRWKTGERVRLEDFAGKILVLDFFAYWCAPCEPASRDLEGGVQQYYGARKGNPSGIRVQVVSVNLEQGLPERTEEFVRRTGSSFIVDDVAGTLLEQSGGTGIPFLVIIDGSGSLPGAPKFEVAYKHAGFEGLRKTRQIINRIGESNGTGLKTNIPLPGLREDKANGPPLVQTIEADTELAWASDLLLTDSKLLYRQERGGTEWDASFSYASFDEDYRPYALVDSLGTPEKLHEDRLGAELNLRQRVAERFTLLGTVGGYDGYPDYRRVWIANRYRQKYGHLQGLPEPGYEEPDPKGWNASGGVRWEYQPTLGFLDLKLGYAFDQTAPGYEDTNDLVNGYMLIRGRERLDTEKLTLSSENILTRRIRALNTFAISHVTDRELRYSYQGAVNLALGERWVARGYGGITTEQPRFDAYFFGLTLEYEPIPNLLVSLTGRYYEDTGEVIDGLPFTSAGPPLKSWEAGAAVRYSWGRAALKLYVAPFWTDYNRENGAAAEFTHLYADRNWGLVQIAGSLQF